MTVIQRIIVPLLLGLCGCASSATQSGTADTPRPAANDWSSEYRGTGGLIVHVQNGSSEDVFVKVRQLTDGGTAAQVSVGPNGSESIRVGSGRYLILLKVLGNQGPRYFKGNELEVPDDARGEATLLVGVVGNGDGLQEINAAEFGS